jgi:hypothetical protein
MSCSIQVSYHSGKIFFVPLNKISRAEQLQTKPTLTTLSHLSLKQKYTAQVLLNTKNLINESFNIKNLYKASFKTTKNLAYIENLIYLHIKY